MGNNRICIFEVSLLVIFLFALVSPADAVDLQMNGNVNITGGVNATSFSGDGSQLTNVPASGSVSITGTSDVNIVNTSVPVSGTVSLSGTPNVNISNGSVPVSGTVSLSGTPNVNISGVSNPIPVQSSPLTTVLVTHQGTDTDYYHDMDASHCGTVRVSVNSVLPQNGSINIVLYNMDIPGYATYISNDAMTSETFFYTKLIETPGVNIRLEIMNYSSYNYQVIVNCRP